MIDCTHCIDSVVGESRTLDLSITTSAL